MGVRNLDRFRTPLKNVRGLGSAKSGTGHFWWQRVSAAALALLAPWLIGLMVALSGQDPELVRI